MHAHSPSELALSSVVKAELLFAARNSQRVRENLSTPEKFLRPFESLPFDDHSAEIYGRIRAELSADGDVIGPNDLSEEQFPCDVAEWLNRESDEE